MPRAWSFVLVRKCVAIAACALALPYVAAWFLWNGWVEGLEETPPPPECSLAPLVAGAVWLGSGEEHATLKVEPLEMTTPFVEASQAVERRGRVWRAPGQAAVRDLARQWLIDRGPLRNLRRGLREFQLDVWLSRRWSATQVTCWLAMHTYFGRGAYGVDRAALAFFGKPVGQLTAGELAFLAGVPSCPSCFSPSRFEAARKRRDFMLRRFAEERLITPEELARELSSELVFRSPPPASDDDG